LTVKAFVRVPIYLSSRKVYLYGREGQRITRDVEIRAKLDKSLKLSPSHFNLEGKVTYSVEEIEKGRAFKIRFTSVPGPPQTYRGSLELKTNYPEKPVITIGISGRFMKVKKGS